MSTIHGIVVLRLVYGEDDSREALRPPSAPLREFAQDEFREVVVRGLLLLLLLLLLLPSGGGCAAAATLAVHFSVDYGHDRGSHSLSAHPPVVNTENEV